MVYTSSRRVLPPIAPMSALSVLGGITVRHYGTQTCTNPHPTLAHLLCSSRDCSSLTLRLLFQRGIHSIRSLSDSIHSVADCNRFLAARPRVKLATTTATHVSCYLVSFRLIS